MAEPEDPSADRLRRQREARRKKILENSKSRLEKLQSVQKSPNEAEPIHSDVTCKPSVTLVAGDPDPPDEIIERVVPLQQSAPHVSWTPPSAPYLTVVVTAIKTDYAYKARTCAALLCALVITLLNVLGGYLVSYVMSMFVLDCTLCVWLFFKSKDIRTNPLGWLAMANIPLSFVHPLLPRVYENVCLCLLLVSVFVRDALFVVFCSVVSVAFVQFL